MAADTPLDTLPPWARSLLEDARVGHLGMLDGRRRPRVLPITFAVMDDAAWSAVDEKPKRSTGEEVARVRWLRARPESALTIDAYDDDWSRLAWVQMLGRTAVVEIAGHDEVLAVLAARYPQYVDQPPRGPLLRLTPERVVCWRATDAS